MFVTCGCVCEMVNFFPLESVTHKHLTENSKPVSITGSSLIIELETV